MENHESKKPAKRWVNILFRIVICILILLSGMWGMQWLAKMKKAPAETTRPENRLQVEAAVAQPESVQMVITGYGEARALNQVALSSEVSGTVVAIHPRLEVGEIIGKGDVLFKIDKRNYSAVYQEAAASVTQLEHTVLRLKKQFELDAKRLKTLERNRDLAGLEFERVRKLFTADKVGTRSGVDRVEQAYNSSVDMVDQMTQAVALYPLRIKETQSSLASARARLQMAGANLERCTVGAPFDGRVISVSIEKGQFVSPGQPVVTLADDSTIEILVAVDSRDAREWLQFDPQADTGQSAWFSGLKKQPCTIYWTEDKHGHSWQGMLHRVVKFDKQTRTITLAVRLDADPVGTAKKAGFESSTRLPLVEGMFCEVTIPGKQLHDIYKLPQKAVSFENTIYVAVENRLKTVSVEVIRQEGGFAYVSGGLKPGDRIITTRLIDPLENALLEITSSVNEEKQS